MKQTKWTTLFALPLAAGLSLWAEQARADSPQPLMSLSATIQGAAPAGQEKSFSEKFAPSLMVTSLANMQKTLAGPEAPKHLAINPRSAPSPDPKNKRLTQFRKLTLGLTHNLSQAAPPKRLEAQLMTVMSWKAPI